MKAKEKLDFKFALIKQKIQEKRLENGPNDIKNLTFLRNESLKNFLHLNENNLNKKRVRTDTNIDDSRNSIRDRLENNSQDLHNQTASFLHNNSSISNSRNLNDNSNRLDGSSIITDNKLIDTKSDITVVNINPGRVSENNSLMRSLHMKKEDNSNLFNYLGKGNVSDSSFIGRYEDNYKSSSDLSGTTYKNNVELNDSDVKEHSFRDKDETVKINEPEYQDKGLTNTSYMFNLLKEKEAFKYQVCKEPNFDTEVKQDNNSIYKLLNETPINEEKKFLPKVVKIAFKHLLDSKRKEKTTKNFVLESEKKDTKKEILLDTDIIISNENILYSVTVYVSISFTLILLLKYISEKGGLSEIWNEISSKIDKKKTLIIVFFIGLFVIYYYLVLKYKLIAKEIYNLIESNLKNKGFSEDYFISETQIKRYCTRELNYSESIYNHTLLPLIKDYLFENPYIETSYLTGDNSIITRWNWKGFSSTF
jgi:hypothetical protein